MNALAAYNKGATGLGVMIGIVDSGIDLTSAEFGTRISSASADTAGDTSIQDVGGHGTAVAFTAAGRRNGTGTHGVAFDANLLIARTDTPGSCTLNNPEDCKHNDTAIAAGIRLATANGARVINISLGGSTPANSVINAVSAATAAGIIVVISAGNDGTVGTPAPNPDPFADTLANNLLTSKGLVIIAGSVRGSYTDSSHPVPANPDTISVFSNRAGDGAIHYLAAVGEYVRAPGADGTAFLWSGTSFSAPQITGAVALLAQAFPSLTGSQIVNLLFSTARDVGDAGIDPIYGNGVLDLTKAFAPAGSTSIANTSVPASQSENAILSTPMGNAQGSLGTIILDSYSRAYTLDLGATASRATPNLPLRAALSTGQRNLSVDTPGMSVAMTIANRPEHIAVERTLLSSNDAQAARVLAGSVISKLGGHSSFAIGFSQTGANLTASMAGASRPAFLIAQDGTQATGFDARATGALALRRELGRWGLTVSAEHGDVLAPGMNTLAALRYRYQHTGYDRIGFGLDRRFGPATVSFNATRLAEDSTLLGARLGPALGNARATSWFADASFRLEGGQGWSLGASYRHGWSFATTTNAIQGRGTIHTQAMAMDLGKDHVFGTSDSFGFRVAAPLRVVGGGVDYTMPDSYDYATTSVDGWAVERLNLTPTGHELDIEARYAFPAWGGTAATNFFWRRDPGNFADLPADKGAALRWSKGF